MTGKFHYDLVVVGTGPAASFFLHRALQYLPEKARILVIDRGPYQDHDWHIQNRADARDRHRDTFVNHNLEKDWLYHIGFGGASNCWWGVTPRMLPNDFSTRSLYGIAEDWPFGYQDLEPYYCDAEEIMAISGSEDGFPASRSRPFPQPPHRLTNVDKVLKAAFPEQLSVQPTARARLAVRNKAACCGSSVCRICPVDAKFTVLNGFPELYNDNRITLWTECPAVRLETSGGRITGVHCRRKNQDLLVRGDLVALATNAIFNAFLMSRSGMSHPWLGKGLNEQVSLSVRMDLHNLPNVGGSTVGSGTGYMFWDGAHRETRPACMLLTGLPRGIRLERGRWRDYTSFAFVFEDWPSQENFVRPSPEDPEKPETVYKGFSDYLEAGRRALPEMAETLAAKLPVERIYYPERWNETEAHILGTTRMGNDPATFVVDANQVHHTYRNLIVLGSSVFPSCSPANPTLTLSACSLRAADKLFG